MERRGDRPAGDDAPAGAPTSGPADPPDRLRDRLTGIRALMLDMDGVLVLRGKALPGAAEAVADLHRRGIPFRLVTNTSLVSRATLSTRLAAGGLEVPAAWIVTAASATAAWTARHLPGGPLYLLAAADSRTEFVGQRLVSHREAADRSARVAAVVVGDAGSEFSFETLDAAFRLVRNGARLVAMHRNRWWLTPAGETIDSGAFVRAIEYATERRAVLVGKPAAPFFREAAAALAGGVAGAAHPAAASPAMPVVRSGSGRARGASLSPGEIAMVGDDVWADIAGARRVGLRTVFVLSGKHGVAELEAAARRARPVVPDAVATGLAEVVASIA